MRVLPYLLLTPVCLALLGTPAHAGEMVESHGYRIELPSGFTEDSNLEESGRRRIRSRLGHLPIDGTPAVRTYTHGDGARPDATITFSRIALEHPVTTLNELGIANMQTLREKLPVGFDFQSREVDGRIGIEMKFDATVGDGERTARLLVVACTDYAVVVVLASVDGAFADAQPTWDRMTATVKIVPGMSRMLMVLLFAAGGLGLLLLLSRLGTLLGGRKVPAPTDHFMARERDRLERPTEAGKSFGGPVSPLDPSRTDRAPRTLPPAPKGLRNTASNSKKWER
jgi:hypothetical protein